MVAHIENGEAPVANDAENSSLSGFAMVSRTGSIPINRRDRRRSDGVSGGNAAGSDLALMQWR